MLLNVVFTRVCVAAEGLTQDGSEQAAGVKASPGSESSQGGQGSGENGVVKKEAPWRHIKFWGLVELLERPDPHERWKWRKVLRQKKWRLQLVDPRGTAWDFKLNGGAWIRRASDGCTKKTGVLPSST